MSRFFKLALCAAILPSLAAALLVGCSGDQQQQAQQLGAEQQQQSEPAASSRSSASPDQDQQPRQPANLGEPLNVVASTQVVADWVRQVGGDRVSVRTLVPAGADAHTLELSVADIRAVAAADLVVINGGGLEATYADAIFENAEHILDLAESIEDDGFELAPFGALAAALDHDEHDDEDDHDHGQEHQDGEMHEDDHDDHGDHDGELIGRLLIADLEAQHISVLDLSTEELNSGAFEISAPPAAIYASPTNRYAFVLARGAEDTDDGIHLFDGGIFLVQHDDHFDLIREPVARHPLVISDERPIHVVNSFGWTAVFADASGYVYLYEEEELTHNHDDYRPVVLDTGPQHGAALMISPNHVFVTSKNPDFPEDSDDSLPVGVEIRTLDDEVVYDASNRSCPGMHGEAHNEEGVIVGCVGGVLFVHPDADSYHHEFLDNPPAMHDESRIGSFFSHHHSHNFFGRANYFDGQGFANDGIWLINPESGEFRQVFSEAVAGGGFGPHGKRIYLLTSDGELHVLDAHDGDEISHLQILEPGEGPAPSLIIVGETMFVTDPANGRVISVDLEHLQVAEVWDVGGSPHRIAYVGLIEDSDAPEAGHDDEQGLEQAEQHEEDDHEQDEHAHDHGDEDPHFWFDTELAAAAIAAIADELSRLNPSAADLFSDRLDRYLDQIEAADTEVRALLDTLPAEHRLLVTFHDAFGYFARRYGLTVAGFLVEGPEQGVSAEAIVELIELIEHEGVTTVFHEPQFDSAILDTVADETGVQSGIIYSQPTEDQPTYLDILRANARAIAEQ